MLICAFGIYSQIFLELPYPPLEIPLFFSMDRHFDTLEHFYPLSLFFRGQCSVPYISCGRIPLDPPQACMSIHRYLRLQNTIRLNGTPSTSTQTCSLQSLDATLSELNRNTHTHKKRNLAFPPSFLFHLKCI